VYFSEVMKAYEEVVEFIAARSPREVVDFKPSPATQQRVADLIQREKNSRLSEEERAELDDYEHLELLMNLAKARARQLLAHGH
jgi:hypothetical protein